MLNENFLNRLMRDMGVTYSVERNGTIISTVECLPNHDKTGRAYFSAKPKTDLQEEDWIIDPEGKRYYIEETKNNIVKNATIELKAYYLTEKQLKETKPIASAPVFNINAAYGSIIGTGDYATVNYNSSINDLKSQVSSCSSPDKEDLEKIVSLLEMVVNGQVPVSKGLFSKFATTIQNNSWITGPIMSTLFGWLTTH